MFLYSLSLAHLLYPSFTGWMPYNPWCRAWVLKYSFLRELPSLRGDQPLHRKQSKHINFATALFINLFHVIPRLMVYSTTGSTILYIISPSLVASFSIIPIFCSVTSRLYNIESCIGLSSLAVRYLLILLQVL